MKKKQEQTASFMVRFSQQIFEENGESKIQWKGKISHVQDGEEQRFSDFNDALIFMQQKLGDLTEEQSKVGSAGLVMAIVGGALMPKLQGMIIDAGGSGVADTKIMGVSEVNFSFILPLLCFVYIAWYGLRVHKKLI
jgi:hypothetical protein